MTYEDLLEQKKTKRIDSGFDINETDLNSALFDFQRHIVKTALKKGCYAVFADCGLGKTLMQLEWADQVVKHTKAPVLLLAPLAVTSQTIQESVKFNINAVELLPEMYSMYELPACIYVINYEQLENINVEEFSGVVLDESSILKNFTGAYKKLIIEKFKDTPYKLACTATPSPNDLNEIGNHSEFLNVLDAQDMRAKWFVRDEGMNNYRLKGHAKKDFYGWISSWAVMFCKPSDIGFSAAGYDLPALNFIERNVKTEQRDNGQLFNNLAVNATNFNKELRLTKIERLTEAAEIVNNSTESFIIWIKQNEEGEELRKLIPDAVEVKGSDSPELKKARLLGFANNEFRVLITKTKIAQFGLNYQNCHNQIFASLDFSFEGLYQAIRRSYRFGQNHEVNIYLITTDTMENVIASIRKKEKQFKEMQEEMNRNINSETYGLLDSYEFREYKTPDLWLMKGDTCIEAKRIPDNSAGLIIYSPPFSSLFTYSNYIHDLGNNENHEDFFKQYRFILEDNYRILKPGRLMVCHSKNLGVYKNSSGYTGMYDFTGEHRKAVEDAGFKLHCIITIWTDPVLEMQRTKTQRLLYKTVTSDSSYTGVGMPEFLYVFKKWEGDESEWEPVTNLTKENFPLDLWQEWASPVYRENLLNYEKEDLVQTILQMKSEIFRLKYDCNAGLPEHWYDDVWFDIKRTDVLNGKEGTELGDEKHIAPLQLEVIHRCVNMWSNPGEWVYTPFLGIGSEPYVSIKNGRKAKGIELKDKYFDTAVKNCTNAMNLKAQGSLFDLLDERQSA